MMTRDIVAQKNVFVNTLSANYIIWLQNELKRNIL